jgi:hypothetical protein
MIEWAHLFMTDADVFMLSIIVGSMLLGTITLALVAQR